LIVSLLGALWSASSGTSNLMKAINVAYDEDETRGVLKLRGVALVLTLGAIVFLLVTLVLVAVVPPVLDALQFGVVGTVLAQVVRWGLLIAVGIGALAVVYRLAPDRADPKFAWTSIGALVAILLWALGSLGFSLYVNNFGSYNKTYGALAGIVEQTRADTTTGDPLPMGERRAEAADTLADPPEPRKSP